MRTVESVVAFRSVVADLRQDVRYGMRGMRQRPGFTAAAILTLAVGMSAATTVFSVVDSVLLRPLPFPASDRLVWVGDLASHAPSPVGPTGPVFLDWLSRSASFSDLAAYSTGAANVTHVRVPQRLRVARVTGQFFSTLGVRPARGRALETSDDQQGAAPTIVLSQSAWRELFDADPHAVGKSVMIDGVSAEVVGIMPSGFAFPTRETSAWLTINATAGYLLAAPGVRISGAIGRLRQGVTSEQAQTELRALERQAIEARRGDSSASGLSEAFVVSLRDFVAGSARPLLVLVLGASVLVVVVACANVANLLLVRAVARHREIGVRRALGASYARLTRQLLTESLMLALAGGFGGILLSYWFARTIAILGVGQLPRATEIGIHWDVLGFTVGLAGLVTVMCGLVPAIHMRRDDVAQALRSTALGAMGNRWCLPASELLVIAQLALTLILLAGAGVLGKSVIGLLGAPIGISPSHVLTALIMRPLGEYPANKEPVRQFGRDLVGRLDALPGVRSSAISLVRPGADYIQGVVHTVGTLDQPADSLLVSYQVVTPSYFRTLGIPLVRGRQFDERDGPAGVPTIMISRVLAARLFPHSDPVGKFLLAPGDDAAGPPAQVRYQIVGIVGDVRDPSMAIPHVTPVVYIPFKRFPVPHMVVLVRSASEPASMAPLLRRVVRSLDPDQPLSQVQNLDELLTESAARPRFYFLLLGAFAAVALVLAVVGLYAIMSLGVRARTRELGVRAALGATRRDVIRLVIGRAAALLVAGVVTGLFGAWAATRLLAGLLAGVGPADPVVFTGVALGLVAAGLVATYRPIRYALGVDATIALRAE